MTETPLENQAHPQETAPPGVPKGEATVPAAGGEGGAGSGGGAGGGSTPAEPPPAPPPAYLAMAGIRWVPLRGKTEARRWQTVVWWCAGAAAVLLAIGLGWLVPNSPLGVREGLLLAALGCPAVFFLVYGAGMVTLESLRPELKVEARPGRRLFGARFIEGSDAVEGEDEGLAAEVDLGAAAGVAKKIQDLTRELNPGRGFLTIGVWLATATIAAALGIAGVDIKFGD